MARGFRRNIKQKSKNDSGFGSYASGRFMNKDGYANVQIKGVPLLEKYSWYHTMLNLSRVRFLVYLALGYIVINFFFALIYYAIGVEHLTGIDHRNPLSEFIDVFFFSSQTFTTVGYGRIAPVGFLASLVATFEAFIGLLAFAVATGLFFGRFSRPRAFLKFSKNALIAPFQDGKALMFRLAPYKNNALIDAEIIVTTAIETLVNEEKKAQFYQLELVLDKINTLSLNWTIVHKIDENSPFYGFTQEDFLQSDYEIIVQVRAFDEVFANSVVQKTSYISSEVVYGAQFLPMYYASSDHRTTILDIEKLDDYKTVELPNLPITESWI